MEKIILELPKESWYESKWLIGLIGVVLGFFLNYAKDYLHERKQKKLLSKSLYTEIYSNITSLEKGYPELTKLFEEFKPIAKSRIFTSHPSFSYIGEESNMFYKQNTNRITILDGILPMNIPLFYYHLNSIKGRAKLAEKNFKDFYEGKNN